MKTVLHLLMIVFMISGCRYDQSQYVFNRLADDTHENKDTTHYPVIIDGGKKIVYQVGHMTPDKGLKLYFDTIPHPAQGWLLDDSIRRKLSANNAHER